MESGEEEKVPEKIFVETLLATSGRRRSELRLYSVRLNNGTAIEKVTIANTER
jgi:hypothetical protein